MNFVDSCPLRAATSVVTFFKYGFVRSGFMVLIGSQRKITSGRVVGR